MPPNDQPKHKVIVQADLLAAKSAPAKERPKDQGLHHTVSDIPKLRFDDSAEHSSQAAESADSAELRGSASADVQVTPYCPALPQSIFDLSQSMANHAAPNVRLSQTDP